MSLRLRLTLLYSAILVLTLIAFSGVLYVAHGRTTRDALAAMLAAEAQTLLTAKEFRLDHIVLPASKFAAHDTFVQTLTVDRNVSDRTENLDGFDLPLSDAGYAAVRDGKAWLETGSIQDQPLLIYSKPILVGSRAIGILQVARSLQDQQQSLGALRGILSIGTILITTIACGIGWILSGAALRPINRITQTAQKIGAERDFGRRVQYIGPHDEVGALVTTFNTMLTELQTAYQQVEQALQAHRRLVADASHELRTPLTTIRGNIGLLQRDPPIREEDRGAALADMADETDRLIRLVNDLLVLARADAGRSWRGEPVAITPLIEDLCRQAKLLEPARPISCDGVSNLVALGDRDAIKQVLLILLDNAVKYTSPNGAIEIWAESLDGSVAISVRDTGIGIAPSALPHIFERFYRGDSSRSGAGTGLGLAIARTLVEAQHGALTVESRPGQGSVFTMTLPQASARPNLNDAPALVGSQQTLSVD